MVETIAAEVREVASAVDVLSSMITPAILILASAAILGTVSSRLIRVVDRVRELGRELRELSTSDDVRELEYRKDLLFRLLGSTSKRARILQRAMSGLFLAIASFIITSIVIGVLSLTHYDIGWLALGVGFVGALLLLSASILLIIESRMAISSTRAETKFIWKWSEQHFARVPPHEE